MFTRLYFRCRCLDRTLRCYSPISRVFPTELMGYQKKNGFVRQTGRVASSSSASASSTVATTGGTLEELCWKNVLVESLPEDPNRENRVRQVEGAMYTRVQPTGTGTEPSLIMASESVAELIGLHPDEFARPEFAMVFSGNAAIPGSDPYANCYGGHQFGHWAGQLGDGRAISLGEVAEYGKDEARRWELQLKGAGKTPYSRMADGRAVLRSSLREYVASEAMAALNVPTTRALSFIATGDAVLRDMFYNGNARMEPGAVVCRVARSFIRFGSFQLPASRGDNDMVKTLADFVMKEYYPEASSYKDFFKTVAERTGRLVAEWHRVGFVHGVLNTDNMSILGDTIDYGPYGWMERFDPNFTPNTTDLPGRRYCFQAQPEIGQWNLLQLARALVAAGLFDEDAAAEGIAAFGTSFVSHYNDTMARKLGLKEYDAELTSSLWQLMYDSQADYTNTFRALGTMDLDQVLRDKCLPTHLKECFGACGKDEEWLAWLHRYNRVIQGQAIGVDERKQMQALANPAIIPRNHVMVEIISQVEEGDYNTLHEYMACLRNPYSEENIREEWKEPAPPEPRLGVELLSCSS